MTNSCTRKLSTSENWKRAERRSPVVKMILGAVIVILVVFAVIWVRSRYTVVRIHLTSPILRPATLSGAVVSAPGAVNGVIVELIPQPENQYKDIRVRRTTTDENGNFSLSKLFPGSYRVIATAPTVNGISGRTVEMPITLSEGEQKQIRLQLDELSHNPQKL